MYIIIKETRKKRNCTCDITNIKRKYSYVFKQKK